jgi:hypothetical protein
LITQRSRLCPENQQNAQHSFRWGCPGHAGFVPLVATALVGAAGGSYWPIPALIAISALIGFGCILLVRPVAQSEPEVAEPDSAGRTPAAAT